MKNRKKRITITALAVLLVLIISLLISGWQIYRSYHYPVIRNITVKSGKDFIHPISIAVIADLHDSELDPGNQELTTIIDRKKPDLIIMAGDMIDGRSQDEKKVSSLIKELSKTAPVYYSLGNQELNYIDKKDPDLCKKIEEAGAVVLDKSFEDVTIYGQNLRIGGLYDYAFSAQAGSEMNPLFTNDGIDIFKKEFEDTNACKIMISHRPDSFIFGNASEIWDLDLVVSGHLHGGQVVLPFLGGLWAGDQGFFPKYCHGLYHKDNIQLLITSGLGSHKETLPRFNNPPEIMVVDIH